MVADWNTCEKTVLRSLLKNEERSQDAHKGHHQDNLQKKVNPNILGVMRLLGIN
jgi:hypothetical protein